MYKLFEILDAQDLEDRIENTIHFDEYSAKMGNDDDIIVSSFKVFGKHAAKDLENFIEKGYNWILDAETSTGEISDSKYLVFIECKRRTWFINKFLSMLNDIKNLTNINEWKMVYFTKNDTMKPVALTKDEMKKHIPLSPKEYNKNQEMLEHMLDIAHVSVTQINERKKRP